MSALDLLGRLRSPPKAYRDSRSLSRRTRRAYAVGPLHGLALQHVLTGQVGASPGPGTLARVLSRN